MVRISRPFSLPTTSVGDHEKHTSFGAVPRMPPMGAPEATCGRKVTAREPRYRSSNDSAFVGYGIR